MKNGIKVGDRLLVKILDGYIWCTVTEIEKYRDIYWAIWDDDGQSASCNLDAPFRKETKLDRALK